MYLGEIQVRCLVQDLLNANRHPEIWASVLAHPSHSRNSPLHDRRSHLRTTNKDSLDSAAPAPTWASRNMAKPASVLLPSKYQNLQLMASAEKYVCNETVAKIIQAVLIPAHFDNVWSAISKLIPDGRDASNV